MDRSVINPEGHVKLPSFSERLNSKTREILAEHEPEPLDADVARRIDAMVAKWHK